MIEPVDRGAGAPRGSECLIVDGDDVVIRKFLEDAGA